MLRETIGLPRLELRVLLVRQLLFGAQVIHALLRLVDGRLLALHLLLELQHARLEDLDELHALLHGGRLVNPDSFLLPLSPGFHRGGTSIVRRLLLLLFSLGELQFAEI